jgi:hypothetical protein
MGIRVYCPNGHRLNVKSFLAGKRGICPRCGAKFDIPEADPAQPADTTGDDIAVLPGDAELSQPREDSTASAPGTASLDQAFAVSPPPGAFDVAAIAAAIGSQPLPGESPEFSSVGVPATAASEGIGAHVAPSASSEFPDVVAASKTASKAAASKGASMGVGRTATATVRATPATADSAGSSRAPAAQKDSAAPAATWYVRHPVHGQFGPATEETIRQWVAEGRITDNTLVWHEGWADWQPASSLLRAIGAAASAGGGTSPSLATLDLDALAAASGATLTSSGALGSPGQRAAARRKSNQTMRVVSLVLTVTVTLLTCLLIYILTR